MPISQSRHHSIDLLRELKNRAASFVLGASMMSELFEIGGWPRKSNTHNPRAGEFTSNSFPLSHFSSAAMVYRSSLT